MPRGRLWVTQSLEYPYPASGEQPARDAVMILEDTDQDGSADRFTKFADGLNIPIGGPAVWRWLYLLQYPKSLVSAGYRQRWSL